jgi:hypothetical protein
MKYKTRLEKLERAIPKPRSLQQILEDRVMDRLFADACVPVLEVLQVFYFAAYAYTPEHQQWLQKADWEDLIAAMIAGSVPGSDSSWGPGLTRSDIARAFAEYNRLYFQEGEKLGLPADQIELPFPEIPDQSSCVTLQHEQSGAQPPGGCTAFCG